ncbi:MAG: endonuclease domain-containing protein [Propionibacteriaceae bacterium]
MYLLETRGAAAAADLRNSRYRIAKLLATGDLYKPFPGVYAVASRSHETSVRLTAAQAWLPKAVLIGEAAQCVFEPGRPLKEIEMAYRNWTSASYGIKIHRIVVPEYWVWDGLNIPDPAWNALWLAPRDEGAAIDSFLRKGGSLNLLTEQALSFKGTAGNQLRAKILLASRDCPWSVAERYFHTFLRERKFTGWKTNVQIVTKAGTFIADVIFPSQKVVVEIDGWEFHGDRKAFETDRFKSNNLTSQGWLVIRVTWRQLSENPDWVENILRSTLKQAAA